MGYLPEQEFWRWAAATDVCINLRFPTAAETSGIAVAMMGIGKAVVFSSGEEIARIPENACLRVDGGAVEEGMLTDYLRWLASDREAVMEIGQRAATHVTREHAIEKVAAQYWDVVGRAILPAAGFPAGLEPPEGQYWQTYTNRNRWACFRSRPKPCASEIPMAGD